MVSEDIMTGTLRSMEENKKISLPWVLFICVSTFFFFEAVQMSYFDVLAPYFLTHNWYTNDQIGSLSAAYYYGNVLGVIPAGHVLDKKNIRKTLLISMFLSVIAALILPFSSKYEISWLARFICGLFGGAICFLGGIKILSKAFPQRFTLAIGLFITVGMLAGMASQLPVLWVLKLYGAFGVMFSIGVYGLIIFLINLIYLHPEDNNYKKQYEKNSFAEWVNILKQWKNFLYGFLISSINTPVSILGNLWGILLLTKLYHFSDKESAIIMMFLFLGLMVGSPLIGQISDRYKISKRLMYVGCLGSLLVLTILIVFRGYFNIYSISTCFFCLGLLGSCQTLVYSWIKQANDATNISRATALNSIILMSLGGYVKQIAVFVMGIPTLCFCLDPTINLLFLVGIFMLLAIILTMIVKK